MYSWEFVNRPVNPRTYGTHALGINECLILLKREEVGRAISAFWAQKIVDALNKADAS